MCLGLFCLRALNHTFPLVCTSLPFFSILPNPLTFSHVFHLSLFGNSKCSRDPCDLSLPNCIAWDTINFTFHLLSSQPATPLATAFSISFTWFVSLPKFIFYLPQMQFKFQKLEMHPAPVWVHEALFALAWEDWLSCLRELKTVWDL